MQPGAMGEASFGRREISSLGRKPLKAFDSIVGGLANVLVGGE